MAGKFHSLSEVARELGTYVDKIKYCAAKAGVDFVQAGTAFVVDDDDVAKIKAEFARMPAIKRPALRPAPKRKARAK